MTTPPDGAAAELPGSEVVVDLGSADTRGRAGVVWSLPHGGDLDANLVHLDPDGVIGSHVNDEVDVMLAVLAGAGRVVIEGTGHDLRANVLAMIPKGMRRELCAGAEGITYLSIHRRRGSLAIGTSSKAPDDT